MLIKVYWEEYRINFWTKYALFYCMYIISMILQHGCFIFQVFNQI